MNRVSSIRPERPSIPVVLRLEAARLWQAEKHADGYPIDQCDKPNVAMLGSRPTLLYESPCVAAVNPAGTTGPEPTRLAEQARSHRSRAIVSGPCCGTRHGSGRHASAGHQRRGCSIGGHCHGRGCGGGQRRGYASRCLERRAHGGAEEPEWPHSIARHSIARRGFARIARIPNAGMHGAVVHALDFSCRSRTARHKREAGYGYGC